MAPHLAEAPAPPSERVWQRGPILDQGNQGTCVGHGWTAWRNAEPVVPSTYYTHNYAVKVYDYAQSVDEFADTPPEEGTSVQAGAKAMVAEGSLKEGYVWGSSYDELISWLGNYGPAVIGSLWLTQMFTPDSNGYIVPKGKIEGGHCYLVYGYKPNGDLIFQNSWGESWADRGTHYMTRAAFEDLLARGDWSICSAAEYAPAPSPTPPAYYPNLPRYSYLSKSKWRKEECVLVDTLSKDLGRFIPK